MQRTLTVRGLITVRLVSSLTTLDLTNKENMLLFVCSEAVGSERVKLETSHAVKSTFHHSECSLTYLYLVSHTLLSLSPVSTLNSLSLSFFLFNVSVDDNCLKGFQVIQAVDKRSHPNPNRASNNFLFLFQLLLGFSFYYYSLLLMTSVTRFGIILHVWIVLGNFWGFILYLAKYWTYCVNFFMLLGQLSMF